MVSWTKALAQHEFAGELSLSGELRPVRGALAMGLALRGAGVRTRLVLPPVSAEEAALVPTAEVYRAQHLSDVVAHFTKPEVKGLVAQREEANMHTVHTTDGWCRIQAPAFHAATVTHGPDLADVKGQAGPRRALEIAAAGGHSLLR
jgi:magnesium chelatase family protein